MTSQLALDLIHDSIMTAGRMCAPILATAIVVGVLVNIVQTVTSVKDMSLTFVPKLAAAAVVASLSLPWGIALMTSYFERTFAAFSLVSP